MSDAEWFAIESRGLTHDQLDRACRAVMTAIRPLAVQVECDLPWENEPDWSAAVREAATRLRDRFVKVERSTDGYQQTGVVTVDDHPEAWSDFTHFVAEAYDATVWDADGPIAQFADQGASITVRLPPERRIELQARLAPIELIPLP